MSAGKLITIEGIDGAGKSTLAVALAAELDARGVAIDMLREPGGVPAAEHIRQIVKDPAISIGAAAEALLYAAARAQLVEEAIRPALTQGRWVLLDRFVDSSLAYQGGGRGLGVRAVAAINEFATGGLRPDRTLLLRLEPGAAVNRTRHRGEPIDRLEREQNDFFERIAATYEQLAREDRQRIRTLDGTQSQAQLLSAALAELDDLL
jgi:dTMP kinase